MNRQISSPPLIILLDLLFLLVFILLVDQNRTTSIEIPKDKLFNGAILIYQEDNIRYLVNQESRTIQEIYQPKRGVGFSYFQKCKNQCREYSNLNQDNIYIYLPDKLFNQIAKITYIASYTDYNCKGIRFKVMSSGEIDYDLLLEDSCLNKIDNIEFLKRAK